jgi:replicative DNA helicase
MADFDPEQWPEGWDDVEPPDETPIDDPVEPPAVAQPSRVGVDHAGAFPTHVLPTAYRHMVHAVAGNKQVPEELPALFGLATIATVVARYVEIARGSGWVEPLTIYSAVVMDVGTGKTPAEKDVTRPLWDIEKRMRQDHAALIDSQIDQLATEQRATTAGRASASNQTEDRLKALEEERATAPDLVLGSDTTLEKLADHLSRNGGAGSIIDSEGDFFPVLSGRYNGGVPNVGLVLKAYDGDRYKVGRIGRRQGDIDRAVLVLGLAIQPVVLDDAVRNRVMLERGLLARFIYGIPPSLLGTRADEGEPYDFDAMKAWNEAIVGLFDYVTSLGRGSDGELPVLKLAARARAQHVRFCGWIERRLHPDDGDLGNMAGWAAKHKARALRIAGLLHLVSGGTVEQPVSEPIMLASIDVCRWAVGHAISIFNAGGVVAEQEARCDHVMTWVLSRGIEPFSVRDAVRGVRKKWVSEGGALAMREILTALCEEGHLVSAVEKNRAGRDCAIYRPHPMALVEGEAA